MTTAVKSDPALWSRIVDEVRAGSVAGPAGTWNARKAQLCVHKYKALGGKYVGKKQGLKNSLTEWTEEEWGYINDKPGNRYLPRAVRERLPPATARTENLRKKAATRKGKPRAKYTEATVKLISRTRAERKSRKSRVSRKKSRKSRVSRKS